MFFSFVRLLFLLQQCLIDNLEIGPVDIQGLLVNHEFGRFRKVIADLPVHLISGICTDRVAKLGLDDHNP